MIDYSKYSFFKKCFYQSSKQITLIVLKISVLGILVNTNLEAQISPGELTKAHSELEGMSNCTNCHELGKAVTNAKCLSCHSEIRNLVAGNKGYHSFSEVKGRNCVACHSEHHGRNFKIVNFNPDDFNHDKTGYKLSGSHLSILCTECHQKKFILSALSKTKHSTYLGLSSECRSCHEDYHQNMLGTDCSSCHSVSKFQNAENFKHENAQFKLTGKHQSIDCEKCHPVILKNNKKFQKFKGLTFSSCESCHNDVHKGKFGNDCNSCHNTSSFHNIARGSFDHNKTNYPLIGKHMPVSCNDCHKKSLSIKLQHDKCMACHSDYHKGDFVAMNIARDCAECHSEAGFKPSSFTIERHASAKFKITGAHLAVPCQSCHFKTENWRFRNIGNDCFECHKNIHGRELTAAYLPDNNCGYCHSTERWNSINFNHSTTNFKLEGKHARVSCERCHSVITPSSKQIQFASTKQNCESCHQDIHYGQFALNNSTQCFKCHGFNDWTTEKFDHEKTKFSLSGAHAKLKCNQCHKIIVEGERTFVKYKMEDFKCASCHT